MSGLPRGWRRIECGQLVNYVTSGSRGWAKYYSDKGALFLRMGNLDHATIRLDLRDLQHVSLPEDVEGLRTRVQTGDILVSITADVGMVGIVPANLPESYINQHVALVRPMQNKVSTEYLAWYLAGDQGGQKQLQNLQRGATKVGLGLDDLRSVQVPLPPLPEQVRIVAKLDELFSDLDAGVANLQKARQQLKVYRQAVLKQAFEGRLGTRKEEEEIHRGGAENAEGRTELPAGWRWETTEAIASNERYALGIGPFGSSLKVSDYQQAGIPLVFVRNITRNDFQSSKKYVSGDKAKELAAHLTVPGDILITKMGDPPGDCAIYPASEPPAIITADCIKFRINTAIANNRFIYFALRGKSTRNQFEKITKGVAQKKVSLQRFRSIVLPLPPLSEQHAIVAEIERRFSVADALEATIDQSLKKAEALRQSILQKAFRGELVPQVVDQG